MSMSSDDDDEPDMFNDSTNSNVSAAYNVDQAAPHIDAAAPVVEVVQVVLAGESNRRSSRRLQAQLRNLVGGLNAATLPLSQPTVAVPEPIVVDVQVVLAGESNRRSSRRLQAQLRNLVGGLNAATLPLSQPTVAVPEPIVVDDTDSDLNAFLVEAEQVADNAPIVLDTSTSSTTSVSAVRKRRRVNSATTTPSPPKPKQRANEDDDDGSTCPICLDSWEMSGEHRLTSLKCGHLFGESCIRHWFAGRAPTAHCCPSCKSKSNLLDIRSIYAKRVNVVDKSEEYRLQKLLNEEIVKCGTLNQELALVKSELEEQTKLNASLMSASQLNHYQSTSAGTSQQSVSYKLSRECTINIGPKLGCRVLIHSRCSNSLIVSQKSVQQLFPGFGVRFIDLPSYRLTSFLHMAAKWICDLTFDHDEQILAAASMDRTCKVFNINNRGCFATFTPSDKPIWSVAFDRARTRYIYFGTQHGSTYAYDVRQPGVCVEEHPTCGDTSPVISISSVTPHQPEFPFGGFLVCKVQYLWFYEYTGGQMVVTATKLALSGPFVSMTYADDTRTVLLVTLPTTAQPTSQIIYAELRKVGQTTTAYVITTMLGSRVHKGITPCAQLRVDDTTLVAAYMQDSKALQTWQVRAAQQQHVRQQAIPIDEFVENSCPIYGIDGAQVHLGALTNSKCFIYKVHGDRA